VPSAAFAACSCFAYSDHQDPQVKVGEPSRLDCLGVGRTFGVAGLEAIVVAAAGGVGVVAVAGGRRAGEGVEVAVTAEVAEVAAVAVSVAGEGRRMMVLV
jgi:hypothetical protein